MIKKIHYCWLGSELPEAVKKQVTQWKALCPEFEFREWNDRNINITDYQSVSYWNRVYHEKRWGFASDIISFAKVYEEGGFYMDCDVTLLKPLNEIPAPPDHLLMGYMYDGVISGGFFYAPPKHPIIKRILEYYSDISDGFYVTNNTIMTQCINNNIPEILMNGSYFSSEKYKLTIFPKEYFCQPSFMKNKSFALDLFAGSWKDASKGRFVMQQECKSWYKILRRKVSCLRSIFKNEFRYMFLMALLRKKVKCKEYWRRCFGLKGGALPFQS